MTLRRNIGPRALLIDEPPIQSASYPRSANTIDCGCSPVSSPSSIVLCRSCDQLSGDRRLGSRWPTRQYRSRSTDSKPPLSAANPASRCTARKTMPNSTASAAAKKPREQANDDASGAGCGPQPHRQGQMGTSTSASQVGFAQHISIDDRALI